MRQARSESFPVSGWGERPIAPPHKLRGLIDSAGRLPPSYADFARGYLLRKFTPREVHREMEAQIARVLHADIRPTRLGSHQHVHLMPGVFDLTLDLAEAYKIRVVRLPLLLGAHTIARRAR